MTDKKGREKFEFWGGRLNMNLDPIPAKIKILLVEDEEVLRRVTAKFLARDDREIFTAVNGREALVVLAAEKIDIIVSDIAMPEMTGFELLRLLGAQEFNKPFIILSGYQGSDFEDEASKLGAFAYLHKPYKKEICDPILDRAIGLVKKGEVEPRA